MNKQQSDRQVGWITVEEPGYVRSVRRLSMRWRRKNGGWKHAILLSTLSPCDVIALMNLPVDRVRDPRAVALAYARLYDQRGGTVEVEIKEASRGWESLAVRRRNLPSNKW